MRIQKVIPGTSTYRKVKTLYMSAFPEAERLPFLRMILLSLLRPSVEILAYYDGEVFCGFSFAVCTDRYLYINFFAVEPALRGKGYGKQMLYALRKRYPVAVICDVKVPVEESKDHDRDISRIRFWEQNGLDFFQNKYTITNPHGVKYYICSTAETFDRDAYWAAFDHLSFGPGAQLRILKRRFQK